MTSTLRFALIPVACLSVVACKMPGAGTKAPTGQVVATVEGQEITVRDLKAELGGASIPDANAMKAAEQQALQSMVNRKILAKAAEAKGIDKTPDFALQKQRLTEGLLVQSYEKQILAGVPKPPAEEASRFVTDHPDIFSERKIFVVDQIQMARPSDPNVIKLLQPLKTLEQIQTFLNAQKIPFKRDSGNLDAVGADPRLIEAIIKLPPGEVFVIPSNNVLLINQIRETKTVPFTGPQAVDYATKVLSKQHAQETVTRQFQAAIKKAAPEVKFNPAYAPAKAAAPTTKPAPTAS